MARIRRVVRWRPAGAAVVFLLAAAAGVAGNQLTGRVTPALVVFAVLVVAGTAITYVLDRHATARGTVETETDPSTGSRTGPVTLHGVRGVQIGDHNRQQNYFGPSQDASGPDQ